MGGKKKSPIAGLHAWCKMDAVHSEDDATVQTMPSRHLCPNCWTAPIVPSGRTPRTVDPSSGGGREHDLQASVTPPKPSSMSGCVLQHLLFFSKKNPRTLQFHKILAVQYGMSINFMSWRSSCALFPEAYQDLAESTREFTCTGFTLFVVSSSTISSLWTKFREVGSAPAGLCCPIQFDTALLTLSWCAEWMIRNKSSTFEDSAVKWMVFLFLFLFRTPRSRELVPVKLDNLSPRIVVALPRSSTSLETC